MTDMMLEFSKCEKCILEMASVILSERDGEVSRQDLIDQCVVRISRIQTDLIDGLRALSDADLKSLLSHLHIIQAG
jgi:hypothetical protein